MSVSSKADLLRAQLNLKNLRRHDPLIEEILGSTPYVTVYYNTGADWTKTGIEGPMFLFSRSSTPRYGFFVLNRQGLEYVQEFLTPESDVKVEGDFILYEPHDQADRATGIWIAEEKDRIELCRRMDEIRTASNPAPAPASASPAVPCNQSISLDMLFASSSSPSAVPKPSPPAPVTKTSTNHPTLDMLFASTSPQPAAQTLPVPAMPVASAPATGLSLLDSIFKSAAQTPPPPAPAPLPPKPNDAAALLAMMGLGLASPPLAKAQNLPPPPPQQQQRAPPAPPAPAPVSAPAPKPAAPTGPSPFAPPLLSHDIFASLPLPGAKKMPSPVVQSRPPPSPQQPQSVASNPLPPPPSQQPQQATSSSSVEQKLAAAIQAEKDRIARSISGPPSSLAPASVSAKLPAPPSPWTGAGVNGVPSSMGRSNGSPATGLNKNAVLSLLDEALEKKGMGSGGEAVGQGEFVREVVALLQKPAFATALYARYLERCEE